MKPVQLMMMALACWAVAGCRPSNPEALMPPPLDGGLLVFDDSFERDVIGDDWSAEGSSWSIEDGWVAVERAENDALWLGFELPDRVRIEFDVKTLSDVGDIKFEVFGDGATHQSGYVGIFGGWSNTVNTIARLDEHGSDRLEGQTGVQVEEGRAYHMSVIRTDNRMRWFVDGEEFLVFDDAAPLVGEGHQHFAFNDWHVPLRFDNVQVYDLSRPPE
jgi:hypothetical protein